MNTTDINPVVNQVINQNLVEQSLPTNTNERETVEIASVKLTDPDGEEYQAGTLSPYSFKQLEKGIEEANRMLIGKNTKFSFLVHQSTGRTVIQLRDIATDEIVKEIPPIKFLDGLANLWEMAGILVDKKG